MQAMDSVPTHILHSMLDKIPQQLQAGGMQGGVHPSPHQQPRSCGPRRVTPSRRSSSTWDLGGEVHPPQQQYCFADGRRGWTPRQLPPDIFELPIFLELWESFAVLGLLDYLHYFDHLSF